MNSLKGKVADIERIFSEAIKALGPAILFFEESYTCLVAGSQLGLDGQN